MLTASSPLVRYLTKAMDAYESFNRIASDGVQDSGHAMRISAAQLFNLGKLVVIEFLSNESVNFRGMQRIDLCCQQLAAKVQRGDATFIESATSLLVNVVAGYAFNTKKDDLQTLPNSTHFKMACVAAADLFEIYSKPEKLGEVIGDLTLVHTTAQDRMHEQKMKVAPNDLEFWVNLLDASAKNADLNDRTPVLFGKLGNVGIGQGDARDLYTMHLTFEQPRLSRKADAVRALGAARGARRRAACFTWASLHVPCCGTANLLGRRVCVCVCVCVCVVGGGGGGRGEFYRCASSRVLK